MLDTSRYVDPAVTCPLTSTSADVSDVGTLAPSDESGAASRYVVVTLSANVVNSLSWELLTAVRYSFRLLVGVEPGAMALIDT